MFFCFFPSSVEILLTVLKISTLSSIQDKTTYLPFNEKNDASKSILKHDINLTIKKKATNGISIASKYENLVTICIAINITKMNIFLSINSFIIFSSIFIPSVFQVAASSERLLLLCHHHIHGIPNKMEPDRL